MVLKLDVCDRIAVVTLNRPEHLNAQDHEMRKALVEAWRRIERDPEIWCGIVTGAGKAFSTGHDLKERLSAEQKAIDPGTAGVYDALLAIQKPMIAAINGLCLAQGAGIALLCDIRITADDVEFGWPQVQRGMSSVSGPAILSRMVPQNIAYEYLFTGDPMNAKQALEYNMVNRVLPGPQVMDESMRIAAAITKNAPLAVQAMKRATTLTQHMRQQDAFYVAEGMVKAIHRTEDAREGVHSYLEKRDPVWRGC